MHCGHVITYLALYLICFTARHRGFWIWGDDWGLVKSDETPQCAANPSF
jgi:hypothetical protein